MISSQEADSFLCYWNSEKQQEQRTCVKYLWYFSEQLGEKPIWTNILFEIQIWSANWIESLYPQQDFHTADLSLSMTSD